jgi:hypothetical protein
MVHLAVMKNNDVCFIFNMEDMHDNLNNGFIFLQSHITTYEKQYRENTRMDRKCTTQSQ